MQRKGEAIHMNAEFTIILMTAAEGEGQFSPFVVFSLILLGCAASRFSANRRKKKEEEKNAKVSKKK